MSAMLSAIVALSLMLSACSCKEAGLEIHETFKPEPCPRKAKITDVVTLHYRGQLENGEVFDSR